MLIEIPIQTLLKSFEHLYNVVFLMKESNGQFIYEYVSPDAQKLASLDQSCIGKTLEDMYPSYMADHVSSYYREAKEKRSPVIIQDKFNMETQNETANHVVIPIIEADQQIRYYICYTQQIYTQNTAYVDVSTGFHSLPSFSSYVQHHLLKMKASATPNMICYIKVRLNKIAMDQRTLYLNEIARRMKQWFSNGQYIARAVEDEFIIYMSSEEAKQRIHELQAWLSKPVYLGESETVLTTAVGTTNVENDGKPISTVINEAYHAMLRAKQQEGNSLVCFDIDSQSKDVKQNTEQELKKAISNNEFVLYFQPIVHMSTGDVHYEVLLRWFSSKLGPVPPDVFIVVAENCGFIEEIDMWVFERVCEKLASETNELKRVSINMSTKTFGLPELERELAAICKKNDIDPKRIELELTEHSLLENADDFTEKLIRLRKSGFSVAIDDFGMSHSSFNYLRVLPVDKIKIDKAFIKNLKKDSREFHIVSSILSLAEKIGVTVTAEGVETSEQALLLMGTTCEELQGYFFSKPSSYETIVKVNKETHEKWQQLLLDWESNKK
ncbi:EAL domain-containing protein [Bacillus suaedae]|uniref:EAL domain-containing protein n=1 Tax=Halalkalibacter suaedae TaxID=2822140 RepID=A0A940WVZ9_9BACI|nr:EAL domain-containing protein [Bacillus suaedae]MBP3952718.1 EAL domain-containing protein [Bacillus suaedae]